MTVPPTDSPRALPTTPADDGDTTGRVVELAVRLGRVNSVAIVCHEDPDPDCLAGATALGAIAEWCGVRSVEYFDSGPLSHPQNAALAEYLDLDLRPVSDSGFAAADAVALVDHAIPGDHDALAPGTPVDIVVDHHEYDRPIPASFADVRPEYGATVTILFEYLRTLGVPVSVQLASALLFALHRERLDHVRRPTRREYEAAAALFPRCDQRAIDRLYRTGKTDETIDTIAAAIRNRRVTGPCLVSWVGAVAERGALPQAADYLLTLQHVDTVLVVGLVDTDLRLSARTTDPAVDLGRVVPRIVGPDGRAGGHQDMAGGVVPDVGQPAADAVVEQLLSQFCVAVTAAVALSDHSAATGTEHVPDSESDRPDDSGTNGPAPQ